MSASPIEDKYHSLGGPNGFLGSASNSESFCADGMGKFQNFANGMIFWRPAHGAHEVHGGILHEWSQNDYERGVLGYPISDEMDWSVAELKAMLPPEGIYKRWIYRENRFEIGKWLADILASDDQALLGRWSRFEHGCITWFQNAKVPHLGKQEMIWHEKANRFTPIHISIKPRICVLYDTSFLMPEDSSSYYDVGKFISSAPIFDRNKPTGKRVADFVEVLSFIPEEVKTELQNHIDRGHEPQSKWAKDARKRIFLLLTAGAEEINLPTSTAKVPKMKLGPDSRVDKGLLSWAIDKTEEPQTYCIVATDDGGILLAVLEISKTNPKIFFTIKTSTSTARISGSKLESLLLRLVQEELSTASNYSIHFQAPMVI